MNCPPPDNEATNSVSVDFVLLGDGFGPHPLSPDPERLKRWFHAVRQYAPWVRNIFHVSDGHSPDSADGSPLRIVHVRPREFLPENALPTDNGHAVQTNLHRIAGLADRFVVFGEDQLLTHPSSLHDWFRKGLPVDTARLGHAIATYHDFWDSYVALNEDSVIQRHFGGRRFVLAHASKWLFPWNAGTKAAFWNSVFVLWGPCPGFRPVPSPVPLLKTTLESVWAAESKLLEETTKRKLQDMKDLSLRLFRVWQFASGSFFPCRPSFAASRALDLP